MADHIQNLGLALSDTLLAATSMDRKVYNLFYDSVKMYQMWFMK
jgi:hypothetical protein